jgi:hypothetical protein
VSWLDRLFRRKQRAPEVQNAMDQRDQDFADLGDAIQEVDRLKNGVLRDMIEAEANRPHRKPR